MRTARDFGGIEQLMPEGIDDIRDCPYHLFDAIQMALQFLSWIENLDEDEVPPRHIWFNEQELEVHFKAVKKARKEKYGADDDDAPGEIEGAVHNDAARRLLVGQ